MLTRVLTLIPDPDPVTDPAPEQEMVAPRKNKKLPTRLATRAAKALTAAAAKASTAAAASAASKDLAAEAATTFAMTTGTTMAATTPVKTTVRGETILTARLRQTTTVCEETPEGGVSKAAARTAEAVAAATDLRLHHRLLLPEPRPGGRSKQESDFENPYCVFIKKSYQKKICVSLYIKKYP